MNAHSLRIILLGRFSEPAPSLADRFAIPNTDQRLCVNLDQLPESLTCRDVLFTDMAWLETLNPTAREELCRRAATSAKWICLVHGERNLKIQVDWLRAGVARFVTYPIDFQRLAAAIEDIRDRLFGAPLQVVFLDDQQSMLAYFGETLRAAGMTVQTTDNPLKLWELLDEFTPDVLLLDVEMPGYRGPELAALIRQQPQYERLPILYLTASDNIEDRLKAKATAAEDFLPKTATSELLIAAVRSHGLRYRSLQRMEATYIQEQTRSRRRLEQLHLAIDEHAIVSIADAQGNIIHINDKFCAVSGYSREELLGKNHRIVKSDQHPAEFYRALWQTISSGKTWHGEICNRRKNGELYWVEASIIPLLDDRGRPSEYISIRTDITSLKRSDERLRRSQVFANIGTWDWSIATGELYWSERIAPLFGYPTGLLETSYGNFLNAVHPEDRQAVILAIDASLERDAPYDIEHRVVWPDGTVRWLLERGAVVRDGNGRAQRMLGVVQDIDRRKRAELALTERERQLREAQSLAHIGNWHANPATGELAWSDEIFRNFGYEPGAIAPSTEIFFAAVHPDDRQRVHDSEQRAAQTGRHDIIHRIVRPDGSVRHVHELAQAELDTAGNLVGLTGTIQDITERIEAEAKLRETEERFAFAIEGAEEGVWDWNIPSGELTLTGHYEAMLGYGRGEIPPTIETWAASVHPDDLADAQKNLHDYLEDRIPHYSIDLRLRCKDGEYKWVLCRGTLVARDSAGQPLRMIGVHTDISARKAAEQALIAARDEADRANLAKSEFLSSMSHELRTPLNAILGFAQLLEYDETLTDDQQENVQAVIKAGSHLLELINEVLDLAKVEAGHLDLSLEPVAIASLVQECLDLMSTQANKRNITLSLAGLADETVRADYTRLRQSLLNLLSNAVKYNREGGSVLVEIQPGGQECLCIRVNDTGPGIPAERIPELFEPFNRLGAESSGIEGTGIGLIITRRIVEMMGGTMGLESTVGAGSTFWIELPRESPPSEGVERDTATARQAALGYADIGSEHTILYIEDNPINLKLVAQVLAHRQHIRLLTAHTPELGVELAVTRHPDLILLDINMPNMDGYQVLGVIREHDSLNDVPVVAVTANAMPRDIERGLMAGFAKYVTKPINIQEFLAIVDTLIAAAPSSTSAR